MTAGKIQSGPGRPKIPPRPDVKARLFGLTSQEQYGPPSSRSEELGEITRQCFSRYKRQIDDIKWTPACGGDAYFPRKDWLTVMDQLIRHPEHSSTDIRRADIVCEEGSFTEDELKISDPDGFTFKQLAHVRRQLKPRRPNLDAALCQDCYSVYSSQSGATYIIYVPLNDESQPVTSAEQVPFYHPSVRAIAFVYIPAPTRNDSAELAAHPTLKGAIEVHVSAFERDYDALKQPQHRLSRTALRLVTLQTKLAWGEMHGYQKRVEHDRIIKREDYMDLYQELRDMYASSLISKWVEATDPEKHVFEDIGITTFLMLLWRDMFPAKASEEPTARNISKGSLLAAAKEWGRPSNFVDVGCGNGLLVHLLNAEGYPGFGIDIRARKTWKVVQELEGGADLRESSLSAPALASCSKDAVRPWPAGSFLIGNHADELTSWLPLIAAADEHCPGLINIPCCRFLLNGVVSNQMKYRFGSDEMDEVQGLVAETDLARTLEELQRGPATESTDSTSRNVAYLRYIAHMHLLAGWSLEKEALRIPSTKNWCIVGRRRTFESEADHEKALQLREAARERIQELVDSEGAGWHARISIDAKSARPH